MNRTRKSNPTAKPRSRPSDASKPSQANRRAPDFPRVEMKQAAQVMGKSGERSHAKLLNLSLAGVGLGLDLKNSRRIFPDGKIRPGMPLQVAFELPTSGNSRVGVLATCRVLWSRQIGKDLFYLGVEFAGFQKDGKDRVERYILDCMRYDWP